MEDTPYQKYWLPSDRIEPTDRDAKVKNLRSVLRRKFHQLANLPDNSPSPDLVLALTDTARHDPVCVTKFICQESGSKSKFKRFVMVFKYYLKLLFKIEFILESILIEIGT